MSKWILTGPALGIGIIAVTLTIAYVVVPPIIVQQVMEVDLRAMIHTRNIRRNHWRFFVFLFACTQLSFNSRNNSQVVM